MLGFYAYQIQRATMIVVDAGREKVCIVQARWNAYSQVQLAKVEWWSYDTTKIVYATSVVGTDTVTQVAYLVKDVRWNVVKIWEKQK